MTPFDRLAKALELFYQPPQYEPGVHPTAIIARTARVPEGAQPLRRVFYTLSAWENRDALYAFARTQPHRGIMASLRPAMPALPPQ